MKIMTYGDMQVLHTIRLWTVQQVQKIKASQDPKFYSQDRDREPLDVEEDELKTHIASMARHHRDGWSHSHDKLLKMFDNDPEKLEAYILETFKQENQAIN